METKEFNKFMDQIYEIVKTQSASKAIDSLHEKLGRADRLTASHALCRLLIVEHAMAKHAIAKYQDFQTRMSMLVNEIDEEVLKEGRIF